MTARPVIIGGGPAGAACAIHLVRQGANPLIIERQDGTRDALCGGFLSWPTLARLEALGLSAEALGGHPVTHLRIVAGTVEGRVPLPHRAMGLSRRRLDRLLLDRAIGLGAELVRGNARLDGHRIAIDGASAMHAECIFVATGKHDLRGLPRPHPPSDRDPAVGLRWQFAPGKALSGLLAHHIELHLFDRGYAGLVLRENGMANLCMAVRKSLLTEAGGSPGDLLARLARHNPVLGSRLDDLALPRPFDAIAGIPYGWRALHGTAGIFRLGDQAGVISSLAGEGIGIALASSETAVRRWQEDGPAGAVSFQADFAKTLRRPLATGQLVAGLAQTGLGATMLARLGSFASAVALVAQATRV